MKLFITLLLFLLISCAKPTDIEEKEAFIPPNDSLFSTVEENSELQGNWGIYCTKASVNSVFSDDGYTPSYKSPGTGEDNILRDSLLLIINGSKLGTFLWNDKENEYQKAEFWTSDSTSITIQSEEFGTTQLSVALALNQYTSDIAVSSDTLRIRLRAVDIISIFLVIAHIEYIDYYYVRTNYNVNSQL